MIKIGGLLCRLHHYSRGLHEAKVVRGELEVTSSTSLMACLSLCPYLVSRDNPNDFVSGFGAQDSTDVLIVPYKPSEPYRRRNYTALMPPCRTVIMTETTGPYGSRKNGAGVQPYRTEAMLTAMTRYSLIPLWQDGDYNWEQWWKLSRDGVKICSVT